MLGSFNRRCCNFATGHATEAGVSKLFYPDVVESPEVALARKSK